MLQSNELYFVLSKLESLLEPTHFLVHVDMLMDYILDTVHPRLKYLSGWFCYMLNAFNSLNDGMFKLSIYCRWD